MVRSEPKYPLTSTRPTRRDPRIPHPSWRQTISGADQGAGHVISAGDFWARLGI